MTGLLKDIASRVADCDPSEIVMVDTGIPDMICPDIQSSFRRLLRIYEPGENRASRRKADSISRRRPRP